jgi:hypothetical protein
VRDSPHPACTQPCTVWLCALLTRVVQLHLHADDIMYMLCCSWLQVQGCGGGALHCECDH